MSAVVGEAIWVGELGDYCTAMAVHGSGGWVAAAANGSVVMVDPGGSGEQVLARATGMAASVVGMAADYLAVGGQDGTVGLWAMPSGKPIDRLVLSGWIDRLAWSLDGRDLAIAVGREVMIWSGDGGAVVGRLAIESAVQDLAWSSMGQLAVAVNGGVQIWQRDGAGKWPTDGGTAQWIELPTVVVRLAWSGDGRYLALGNQDATLVILDWEDLDRPWVMRGLSGKVRQLLWWEQDLVMTCGSDVVMWWFEAESDLWEAEQLKGPAQSVEALEALGNLLVAGGDRLCVWDRSGELLETILLETTALAGVRSKDGDPTCLLGVGQPDGGFGVLAIAQRV